MIGFHVSKQGEKSIVTALKRDIEWARESHGLDMKSAQIFVMGPQSRKETLDVAEVALIKGLAKQNDITLVVHSAYINVPWKSGKCDGLIRELNISNSIGSTGVVVHLSKDATEAMVGVLKKIDEGLDVDSRETQTLWLEINAAKPTDNTFETTKKLGALFDVVKSANVSFKVGLCIDTAHLCGCGMNLNTEDKMLLWLGGLPKDIPIMLHLNDSYGVEGTGQDLHAPLMDGFIWDDTRGNEDAMNSLIALLDWVEENEIVTILERDRNILIKDFVVLNGLQYFQK